MTDQDKQQLELIKYKLCPYGRTMLGNEKCFGYAWHKGFDAAVAALNPQMDALVKKNERNQNIVGKFSLEIDELRIELEAERAKVAELVEKIKPIAEPFIGNADYVDRAVRAQEIAYWLVDKYKGGV